jgi:large subunit ribosomal protein L31
MKKEIHPNYGDATITCACGNVIQTRSTVKEMHVNNCLRCHPYYTGQTKLMDTEGRVQRFQKRYARPATKA